MSRWVCGASVCALVPIIGNNGSLQLAQTCLGFLPGCRRTAKLSVQPRYCVDRSPGPWRMASSRSSSSSFCSSVSSSAVAGSISAGAKGDVRQGKRRTVRR